VGWSVGWLDAPVRCFTRPSIVAWATCRDG
jgi:hypothetical protein